MARERITEHLDDVMMKQNRLIYYLIVQQTTGGWLPVTCLLIENPERIVHPERYLSIYRGDLTRHINNNAGNMKERYDIRVVTLGELDTLLGSSLFEEEWWRQILEMIEFEGILEWTEEFVM